MRRACLLVCLAACAGEPEVRVGSKVFTESVVLGEIMTRLVGPRAVHVRQLGGTQVLWNALIAGEIDAYPEYTGTIRAEILAGAGGDDYTGPGLPPVAGQPVGEGEAALREALAARGVLMGRPLGFNNTYAVGVREALAARLGLRRLSDLAAHPSLALGFSNEFMERADGWPALRARYGLGQTDVRGLDHDLAYRALESGVIAATDLYSTDAEIRHYGLRVLEDDRHLFPDYQAVVLMRADLAPEAARALARLEGAIPEAAMIEMNARAKLERVPEAEVAAGFLARLGVAAGPPARAGLAGRLARNTRDHLVLVGISLLAAVLAGIPLGVLAARRPRLGQVILAAVGVVQTIPSLALLVFMIPLLGIGARPAIVALFLYSLLPIVRNTFTGLRSIPAGIVESARALGLSPGARLRLVELPVASPAILAGVKTSAVINVGTATLGALIGAGGFGQPILTGIRLDDVGLILEGALPAALLALLVQGMFEAAERWLVPRGLRS